MVSVRKAGLRDVPALRRIDSFGEQLEGYSGLDSLDTAADDDGGGYYRSFIFGKRKWCYLAELDGAVVGFILFNVERRPAYFKVREVGYIDLLFVAEDARGRGVSKALMGAATDVLGKEGMEYLKLSVHVDNPAHRFWKKQGFEDYRVDMWREV